MNKNEREYSEQPHIIYSGHFVPESWLGKFQGPAVSGNRMQLGIINAIKNKCRLSLLSTTPIASYPREKTVKIKGETVELFGDLKYTKIPFLNLFIIKQMTQMRSLRKALQRLRPNSEDTVIVNFNPYVELAIPTLKFAKKHKIKTVCIVADIPTRVPDSYGLIKRWLRCLEIKKYHRNIGKYDGLVVLNKEVVNHFASDKSYYLMDGGVTEKEIERSVVIPPDKHDNSQILYAGALESYNGIKEMIEGFLKVDKNLTLVICGDGALAPYVKEMSEKHENIIFKGRVAHQEAVALQRSSGLLISTRPVDDFEMKVTFPSKIIEYMLSGTPVLTTRLNGLTTAYEDKLFFCGQIPSEIAKGISDFFDLPIEKRYERATLAREFVENEKTYTQHSVGILHLIEKVLKQ